MSKIAQNYFCEFVDRESLENGTPGIRCVALHPGSLKSEMADMLPTEFTDHFNDTPELPGSTAVYLSTERATFLMGRYVSANWDMEEVEKLKERVEAEDLLKTRVNGGL